MKASIFNSVDQVGASNVRYGISVGRRQPMHVVHTDCLLEIAEAGLHPVVVIGSSNTADNPFFDPTRDPLPPKEQREQISRALKNANISNYTVLELADLGHMQRWCKALYALLAANKIEPRESAMHFRSKSPDSDSNSVIRPLSAYQETLMQGGIHVWHSSNRDTAHDVINASPFRTMDLFAEENQGFISQTLATPNWLKERAKAARNENPDKHLLKHLPITLLDIGLLRLLFEAKTRTAQLMHDKVQSVYDLETAMAIALKKVQRVL